MTSDEHDPHPSRPAEPVAGAVREPAPAPAAAAPTNPFVPRYREPWINPAKRTSAILLGVATGAALLVIGLFIGLGLGGGRRHEYGPRFEMRGAYGYQMPGRGHGMWRFPHPGFRRPYGPLPGPVAPSTAPPPSPVPSSSHR